MKNFLKILSSLILFWGILAQGMAQNIGINSTGTAPDNSAMLDISSNNKGVLIPRMDSTSRKAINNPTEGLMVFDSTYNNFYVFDGISWTAFGGGSDHLGNHIALQNLRMNNNWLSNDGGNEGIYVDTNGQVGVGISPATDFHVSMGKFSEVNTSNAMSDWFLAGDLCQSFTVTKDGELASIEVAAAAAGAFPTVTYNLYEGHGTGGTLIAGPLTQTNIQAPFPFSGVNLVKDQSYTIEIINPGIVRFDFSFSDEYPGGYSCDDPFVDYYFKVNLLIDHPGFRINDTLVQFNEYKLPITDGTASQLLLSDGAGNLSWTTIINTDAQDLSRSGNTLSLSNDATTVDLSGYLDNTDAQDLNRSGNTLSVSNDVTTVDLSPYADNTDAQDLNRSGNTLSLSNDATTIDLSAYIDNTDAQDLSLSGNTLSLSNDATTVDLSGYLDNTDAQDLSLSGSTLSLSNDATSVDLSPFLISDNFGSHTANQHLQLNGNWLNNDGGANEGINISNTGQVGINTVPTANFHIDMGSGTNFQISNSGVTINQYTLPIDDGTLNQVLATDGSGTVQWANGPASNLDNLGNHSVLQNLQLNGNWLSNDGGNEGIIIDNSGKIGFGRTVGTIGTAKTEYYGLSGSLAGPHTQVVGSTDNYPLFQQLNWGHNNIALLFDAYYDGLWRSSNTSNFSIYKTVSYLYNYYSKGNAQGAAFSWEIGTSLGNTGNFGIGRNAPTNTLEVEGNASKTTAGNWLANSDARLKKNISPLSAQETLDQLLSLQGLTYEWDDDKTGTQRPEGIQYGFTAQNIQEVFPALVSEDNKGYLQTPYDTYDAMTVEALRALNEKISQLEKETVSLETQVQELNEQNQQLENHAARMLELKASFVELKAMLEKE